MKYLLGIVGLALLLSACNPNIEVVCAPNPKHTKEFWAKAAAELESVKDKIPHLVILLDERDNFSEAAKRCAQIMKGKKVK
jgi:nanoRNase/pAp phosphatase (c-di-AMP/oligoRNAs hydrolase)